MILLINNLIVMVNNATNNQHSATLDEVLEAVNFFADKTERRFDYLEGEISGIKGEISGINGEIKGIKEIIVTKDYLDEKMSDLRGDLVVMMRKEDTKLMTLVGVLASKKVLDNKDVRKIYALEPFAQ